MNKAKVKQDTTGEIKNSIIRHLQGKPSFQMAHQPACFDYFFFYSSSSYFFFFLWVLVCLVCKKELILS